LQKRTGRICWSTFLKISTCKYIKNSLSYESLTILNVYYLRTDLRTQICPKDNNDRKYVRIQTYNNKYIWAYATENGNKSYIRTRCCGGKDAVGRADVLIPGIHTTFRVHCGNIDVQHTVRFEVLTDRRTDVARSSGYYFYADTRWNRMFSKRSPSSSDRDANFILTRWRGSVVAIKSARNRYWWAFSEDGHGSILIRSRSSTVERYPRFPPLYDAFTLEMGRIDVEGAVNTHSPYFVLQCSYNLGQN